MRDGTKMLLSFGVVLCIAFAACCYKNENVVVEQEYAATEVGVIESETKFEDVQTEDADKEYDPYMWYRDSLCENNGMLEIVDENGLFVQYRFIDEQPVAIGNGNDEVILGHPYAVWFDDNYKTNGNIVFAFCHNDGWFVPMDMPKGWNTFLKDNADIIGSYIWLDDTDEIHYIVFDFKSSFKCPCSLCDGR